MKSDELKLTHLDKIFWPEEKITKGDILDYYQSISEVILPYLIHRPQVLHRFPDGMKGIMFYQKDMDDPLPSFIKTVKIHADSEDKDVDYLVCENEETLLYMVNLGAIEINPWHSTEQHLHKPDYLILDLDPEDISFQKIIDTALATKEVLDDLEIKSFCKTSGKTGLHIYIPLARKYSYDQACDYAKILAEQVHEKTKAWTSLERDPKNRQKKVYIDYLQNRFGQTVSCAYSVRPVKHAQVSTPLEWKEINNHLDPTDFTIKTIIKRVEEKGDLWKGILEEGVNLEKVLK